jgi:hypothetical protein
MGFCWVNLRERDHFEELDVNGRTILKPIFRQWDEERTGLSWFRTGTGGGVL